MRKPLMLQLYREAMTVDFEDVGQVSFEDIVRNILLDPSISQYRPLSYYQIDPRSGERVVYSEARAKRPHDTPPLRPDNGGQADRPDKDKGCIVCEGKTTSIIDLAPLSEGFTFINKNLFPVTYPFEEGPEDHLEAPFSKTGHRTRGVHFLQWPSNLHDKDFHNMRLEDIFVVLKRLCLLEEKLLHSSQSRMPLSHRHPQGDHHGYIGAIKNVGRLVGGSITHGHHQVIHTNIKPGRVEEDERFREVQAQPFSEFILNNNPPEYTIKEYGRAVVFLVPYFMKRPLGAMIIVKDTTKGYLHHLAEEELYSLGAALKDASASIVKLMPGLGRELAYNWIIHEGDIGGMYIEFLPWTQEMGGYEQLGIYLCQGLPCTTVDYYKERDL